MPLRIREEPVAIGLERLKGDSLRPLEIDKRSDGEGNEYDQRKFDDG